MTYSQAQVAPVQQVETKLFSYEIHQNERYIETYFYDKMSLASVMSYFQQVWMNHPDIVGFSELIDLKHVEFVDLDTGELANLVQAGRALDDSSQRSKIAIVVIDSHSFFKGELYKTLQHLYPAENKEVEVFQDSALARAWIVE